jgi:hypothetical protein
MDLCFILENFIPKKFNRVEGMKTCARTEMSAAFRLFFSFCTDSLENKIKS